MHTHLVGDKVPVVVHQFDLLLREHDVPVDVLRQVGVVAILHRHLHPALGPRGLGCARTSSHLSAAPVFVCVLKKHKQKNRYKIRVRGPKSDKGERTQAVVPREPSPPPATEDRERRRSRAQPASTTPAPNPYQDDAGAAAGDDPLLAAAALLRYTFESCLAGGRT